MPEEVVVEASEFSGEAEPAAADGAGEAALAPAVDAVAVVAVLAGSCADLVVRLELQQTYRAGFALLFGLRGVLLLACIGLLLALSVEGHWHEHLEIMQVALVRLAKDVLLGVDPLPAQVAGQPVQVEGFDVERVDVQGFHRVLLLEVGDEARQDDEQDEGREEDDEGAVIGRLQIHLVGHPQLHFLHHHLLIIRLFPAQLRQLAFLIVVSIEVLVTLVALHHLQPHHDLPERIVISSLYANIMS